MALEDLLKLLEKAELFCREMAEAPYNLWDWQRRHCINSIANAIVDGVNAGKLQLDEPLLLSDETGPIKLQDGERPQARWQLYLGKDGFYGIISEALGEAKLIHYEGRLPQLLLDYNPAANRAILRTLVDYAEQQMKQRP